LDLRK